MATPQDYTSMPWAPRSSIGQEDASSASLQTATPNTQVLIEQLAASLAVQHQQKRRIAELHAEMEKRDRDTLRSKEQRVGDLSKELEQCRKREAAVQAVFIKNHEREQELAKRERAVEEKEARLKEQEEDLDAKEEATSEKLKELEQLRTALGLHTPNTSKLEADRIRQKAGVNYLGPGDYVFCSFLETTAHFKTTNFPISAEIMKSQDVQTLRRHDYYTGYYNCAYQTLMKKWARTQPEDKVYLYFDDCYTNPESNGRSAGALFTFAALCANHKPEWDMRLDGKTWILGEIEGLCSIAGDDSSGSGFWYGFASGVTEMKAKFEKMLEEEA